MVITDKMRVNMFNKNFTITKPSEVLIKCYYQNKNDELEPCTIILADYKEKSVKIENYTNNMIHRAFGVVEHPTWEDYNEFLESRCFPRTRHNAKDLLKMLGLADIGYEPLEIIKKTDGRMAEDRTVLKVETYNIKELDKTDDFFDR